MLFLFLRLIKILILMLRKKFKFVVFILYCDKNIRFDSFLNFKNILVNFINVNINVFIKIKS